MENNTIALVFVAVPISMGGTLLASIYGAMIALGLVGNCWVAWVLFNVLLYGKADAVPRSMLVLILALCASDLVILYSLLLMLLDLILGQWVFGSIICVCSVTLDMANKFFTPFLLAVLSGTCYVTITGGKTRMSRLTRPVSFAFKALALIVGASLLVASPAAVYGRLLLTPQGVVPSEEGYLLPVMRKCGFYPPSSAALAVTIYGTVIGYVLPLGLFSFFYLKVALFVRAHNRSAGRMVPICVGKMIFGLLSVYAVSWTPFWVGAWVVCLVQKPGDVVVVLVKMAHLLPYISCIVYPAIYTLMNRQIQREHARLQEVRCQKRMKKDPSVFSLRSVQSMLDIRQLDRSRDRDRCLSVGSSNPNHIKEQKDLLSIDEKQQMKYKFVTDFQQMLFTMGERMSLLQCSQPNLALPAIQVTDCDQIMINS